MKFTAALKFDGNCREAFETYARIFGVTIKTMLANRDVPVNVVTSREVERPNNILHAWLDIGDQSLLGNDELPQHFQDVSGFVVCIRVGEIEEGRRVFDDLAEGGTVKMPFGETFWSKGFGMVTDSFGTPWMIDAETQAPD